MNASALRICNWSWRPRSTNSGQAARVWRQIWSTTLMVFVSLGCVMAETSYRLPAPEIVRMIDAPPPPRVSLSPRRDAMLLVDYEANPPLELLARPLHRLAGLRIDATLGARQRASRNTRLTWLRLADGSRRTVPLPEGSFIGFPVWSPDGSRCAFTRDTENGVELWVADLTTGEAKAIPSLLLNDVTGPALEWRKDSQSLLVRTVPPARCARNGCKSAGQGNAAYDGRVRVRLLEGWLEAPHLEGSFAESGGGGLKTATATGGVRFEFRARSAAGGLTTATGKGDRAVFEAAGRVLRLFGDQGAATIVATGEKPGSTSGRVLRYELETGALEVESGDRDRAVIKTPTE